MRDTSSLRPRPSPMARPRLHGPAGPSWPSPSGLWQDAEDTGARRPNRCHRRRLGYVGGQAGRERDGRRRHRTWARAQGRAQENGAPAGYRGQHAEWSRAGPERPAAAPDGPAPGGSAPAEAAAHAAEATRTESKPAKAAAEAAAPAAATPA